MNKRILIVLVLAFFTFSVKAQSLKKIKKEIIGKWAYDVEKMIYKNMSEEELKKNEKNIDGMKKELQEQNFEFKEDGELKVSFEGNEVKGNWKVTKEKKTKTLTISFNGQDAPSKINKIKKGKLEFSPKSGDVKNIYLKRVE